MSYWEYFKQSCVDKDFTHHNTTIDRYEAYYNNPRKEDLSTKEIVHFDIRGSRAINSGDNTREVKQRILIFAQDDCAPDSYLYFNKEFVERFGESVEDWKKITEFRMSKDGMTMSWRIDDYILEYSGDDPFYRLYKENN